MYIIWHGMRVFNLFITRCFMFSWIHEIHKDLNVNFFYYFWSLYVFFYITVKLCLNFIYEFYEILQEKIFFKPFLTDFFRNTILHIFLFIFFLLWYFILIIKINIFTVIIYIDVSLKGFVFLCSLIICQGNESRKKI